MNKSQEIKRLYTIYANRLNKSKLSAEEFQPLVLNIAYLEVEIAKRNHLSYDPRKLFIEYTQAALEVIPEYEKEVNDPRYPALFQAFALTCEWDGLWNFLRDYFETNLGISIDNETRKIFRFDSSLHKRFENNVLITTSQTPRKISINLSEDLKNAQISISESLSNKEANLYRVIDNKYIYIGTDPDFMFEFILDDFNNIEKFSLTRTDRNLRIEYLE